MKVINLFARPFLFLLLLSLPLYFLTVNNWSLNDADESFYAQIAKEMVQGGDWSTLHYKSTPFFHKTPLVFWAVAVCYKIFGINEFSARLPIIILAIMSIFLIYLIAQELFKDFFISFLSSVILLTTYHFIHLGHMLMLDVPTVFFILLGLYGLLHSSVKKEWAILYGLSLGSAVLSKGVLGIILVICIIPYIILQKKFSYLRNPYLWIGMISGAVLCGSWYFCQIHIHGNNFWKIHFGQQVLQRSLSEMHSSGNLKVLFYPMQIFINFLPWSVILPFAFFESIKSSFKNSDGNAFIVSWTIAYFLIITFMRTKLPHYVLPIYPFAAISVGWFLVQFCREGKFSKGLGMASRIYIILSAIIFTATILVVTKNQYYLYYKYVPAVFITGIFFVILSLFYLFFGRGVLAINKIWVSLLAVGTYAILIFSIINLKIWDFNPDIKKLARLNTAGRVYCAVPPDRPDVCDPAVFYFGNALVTYGSEDSIKKIWKNEDKAVVLIREESVKKSEFIPYEVIASSGEWVLVEKRKQK